ncbi:MAG: NAD-binding protein, partial [Anaerolineae bacterium]|nr:NAD-binding protein [Phycisphaerae bacterium]
MPGQIDQLIDVPAGRRRRRDFRTGWLYALAVIHEFRWTLLALLAATAIGTAVFAIGPSDDGARPGFWRALYGAWMALLAQQFFAPGPWYVGLVNAIYPLLGVVLIGEGIVRFGWLMISRRRGEKEWMKVMASTYRDHVIIAGLGHLGFRIYEQLRDADVDVVILDASDSNSFVIQAKADGAAVLIRDMQEDQSLIDAGIEHARAIIIATNKDMANLEAALDARRMNPNIRVLMRLFDQRIAEKIKGALTVDVAFSSSSLAAPMVAAMALETKVLSSIVIGGVPHAISEVKLAPKSALAGKRV